MPGQTCYFSTRVILSALLLFLLFGCNRQDGGGEVPSGAVHLEVWAHAGQEAERTVLREQVDRFRQHAPEIDITLVFIPERDYNAQVQAAAIAGDMPDILEFDGPYLSNYIWQNQLIPLEGLLSPEVIADLLPSIIVQGTRGDHLYSVAAFDSGLGLFARRSQLEGIDARIPRSSSQAWSAAEFEGILRALAQSDADGAVLDMKLNYGGEWFTFGFSPILQSAGADLIERRAYQRSTGVINSPEAVAALQRVQDWIRQGLVDPNLDDAAFVTGRVALSWVGHWEYSRYREAFPDDLVLVPLPDFGRGSRTGQGSWNWGITRNCPDPQQAADFLHFLLRPSEVLAMSNANGAVPGTESAVARSPLYGIDGPLRLFAEQLMGGVSVPRPRTPAYPVITTEFQQAVQRIRNNVPVREALDRAAANIDQDIRDNHGYPFKSDQ